MTTTIQDTEDIFSIFHDGTISEWTGDKNLLTLKVDCQYLAELIDKSFDSFYVDLIDVDKIELDPWTNPIEIPAIIKKELEDIFKAGLTILSATKENDTVIVTCIQDDKNFDYSGGNLSVRCKTIKIYDQNKNEMTIDSLGTICKNYWDDFGKT